MKNNLFLMLVGWSLMAQNAFAVKYIFNNDGLGHYTCHDTTKKYGTDNLIPLENCKEGVQTYFFFYSDFDYQDKCYEQDVETFGYKYRNVVDLVNCRQPNENYIYYFVKDIVGSDDRCYEIDEKTQGHRFRAQVELINCRIK